MPGHSQAIRYPAGSLHPPPVGCKENNWGDPAVQCYACPISSRRPGFTAGQVFEQCGERLVCSNGSGPQPLLGGTSRGLLQQRGFN